MKLRLVFAFVLAALVTSALACGSDKPPMVPDQDLTADASAE
jgi:predicted small lipoprotein YifL